MPFHFIGLRISSQSLVSLHDIDVILPGHSTAAAGGVDFWKCSEVRSRWGHSCELWCCTRRGGEGGGAGRRDIMGWSRCDSVVSSQ